MRRCLVVGIFKHFFLPLSAHCFGFRAGKLDEQFGSASLLLSRQLFLATICQRSRT